MDINPLVVLDEGRGAVAVDWLIEGEDRSNTMAYETILYEKQGPVATHHAQPAGGTQRDQPQMTAELHRALGRGRCRREVRAIILTGAGRGFSAGYDIARRPDGRAPLDGRDVETPDFLKAGGRATHASPSASSISGT